MCSNKDEPRGYYIKWNKPDTERQSIVWSHSCGI
jgi:hypothetical protein